MNTKKSQPFLLRATVIIVLTTFKKHDENFN